MPLQLTRIWKVYKLIFKNILTKKFNKTEDASNWRAKIFIKIILYATPLSLLALLPSVIILFNNGRTFLPLFDCFILLSIPTVALISRIKLSYQKAYVVLMLYLLAVIKTVLLGSFEIGAIYLLALSVFISLLFSSAVIITSVIANICIYTVLGLIIHFQLFNSQLINKYPVDFWIFYSSNFLFLNMAIVVIIRHIITGIEKTISQQANLRMHLQHEVNNKNLLNAQLIESVGHYKSLFFRNPSPMWIFDSETLRFLQVNGAAIRKYGYTRAQFKLMTIKDIRPKEDIESLLDTLDKINNNNNGAAVSTVRHMGKNGKPFYAQVRCSDIVYRGKTERLVISTDITQQIQYTQAIEKQNEQLREIAYLQSHIVRAPLSRILGLVNMLKTSTDKQSETEIIAYLDTSARELDEVIRAIVNKTEGVDPVNHN
ncbi:PAS domain S-box protein [Mucilaginibacter lutimaris]|uniref:PAS domain S-box protein n=1 Tax=Mucilaginibacter lutimaris TaxID=931629 RepID=A0ABW2ZB25_9SPHI